MHIAHLAIWVKDLEILKTFYENYFGAQTTAKHRNAQKQFQSYFLKFACGARLELMHRPGISTIERQKGDVFFGYAHLAIAVGSENDVDELTFRLAHDGYQLIDGPRWTGDGYYESVVLDPEGNHIEITV